VGRSANGATRWIAITSSISFQPSELAKLALAVWGADLLARKEKLGMLADWRHMLVPLMPGTGLLALLVMAGDDVGTTFVLLIVFLALLWFAGTPGRVFSALLILMGMVLLLLVVTQSWRIKRITGLFDTSNTNPVGSNQQAIQGRVALGDGACSALGSARARSSGAGCLSRPATSSSRSSGRNSAWSARSASPRCTAGWRSPGCGSRAAPPTRSAGSARPRSPRGSSSRRS
jgi:cell division protein FtsW